MPKRLVKGSPEAKAFGAKMKAAREAKKAAAQIGENPVVPVVGETVDAPVAKEDSRYAGIEVKNPDDVFRGAVVMFSEGQNGVSSYLIDGKRQQAFYCSINGKKYYYPINKRVDIPREVLSLLVDIGHPAARSAS